MNKHPLTDKEVEAKLFALADATRDYDRPALEALLLRSLREKHAELMRRRRRVRRTLAGIATACIVACACALMFDRPQGNNTGQPSASVTSQALATHSMPSVPLLDVSTPCSQGFFLTNPAVGLSEGDIKSVWPYYTMTLETLPL